MYATHSIKAGSRRIMSPITMEIPDIPPGIRPSMALQSLFIPDQEGKSSQILLHSSSSHSNSRTNTSHITSHLIFFPQIETSARIDVSLDSRTDGFHDGTDWQVICNPQRRTLSQIFFRPRIEGCFNFPRLEFTGSGYTTPINFAQWHTATVNPRVEK